MRDAIRHIMRETIKQRGTHPLQHKEREDFTMKSKDITINGHRATDEELKNVITEIRNNNDQAEDKVVMIQKYGLNCSYRSLQNVCDERGIIYPITRKHRGTQGQTQTTKQTGDKMTIKMKKTTGKTVRKMLTVSEDIARQYDEVTKDLPYPSVCNDAALMLYIDAVKNGRIQYVL